MIGHTNKQFKITTLYIKMCQQQQIIGQVITAKILKH